MSNRDDICMYLCSVAQQRVVRCDYVMYVCVMYELVDNHGSIVCWQPPSASSLRCWSCTTRSPLGSRAPRSTRLSPVSYLNNNIPEKQVTNPQHWNRVMAGGHAEALSNAPAAMLTAYNVSDTDLQQGITGASAVLQSQRLADSAGPVIAIARHLAAKVKMATILEDHIYSVAHGCHTLPNPRVATPTRRSSSKTSSGLHVRLCLGSPTCQSSSPAVPSSTPLAAAVCVRHPSWSLHLPNRP